MDRTCPNCRHRFTVVDEAAPDARCPRCGRPVEVHGRFRRAEVLPSRFTVEVDRERGRALVRPRGDLDLSTVDALERHLEQARQDAPGLVVDLAGLSFLDSTGVRLLLRWHKAAQQEGFDLAFRQGGTAVQEVLDLTGVTDLLPFEPSER